MGGLDILINNAGVARDNLALRLRDEDWNAVLDLDLGAPFRLCRAALRGMMKRRWGAHYQHYLRRRRCRQRRTSQLRGREGGPDWLDEVARAGGGEPRHHRELRRARLYRNGHDRRPW